MRENARGIYVLFTLLFFFIESLPGRLIFGFLLGFQTYFLLENLEPIQLRESNSFHSSSPR